MTTKILTGAYDFVYTAQVGVTTLSIAASGYLFGGVYMSGGSIINDGGIYGVAMVGGGSVDNDGVIRSTYRFGVGVDLSAGGNLTNGDATHTGALIEGGTAQQDYYHHPALDVGALLYDAGTVTNFGTIEVRTEGDALVMENGGLLLNGSTLDTSALITSTAAVIAQGALTVVNYGTIAASKVSAIYGLAQGMVTNGSSADTAALINGVVIGASIGSNAGTVINMATIAPSGASDADGPGVQLTGYGKVTNGSESDTGALISGYSGVVVLGAGTVVNDATITGAASGGATDGLGLTGVILYDGGLLTNGAAGDTRALIGGDYGVTSWFQAAGTVKNFGTIAGVTGGVQLAFGTLTNGSASDLTATITGDEAVDQGAYTKSLGASGSDPGPLAVTNFGTIEGVGSNSEGVVLVTAGGRLTNGSAADHTALISGYFGILDFGVATVTNFGTIAGTGGYALAMAVGSRLDAEAGSVFEGAIDAGEAVIDVVSGVAVAGAVITDGSVIGAGTLALNGGVSSLSAAARLLVADIDVSGAATAVNVYGDLGDSRVWAQTGGTLDVAAGYEMSFSGAGDAFAGTLTGAGTIAFTGGSDTLSAVTLSTAHAAITKAVVTLTGQETLTTTLSDTGAIITIAAAGVTLTGGGAVDLTNNLASAIKGASASTQLTDVNDLIEGAGQLGDGQLKLTIDAGATVKANLATTLVINTGANTLASAGLIETTSTGGLTIDGAVANTGTLEAAKGTLTVGGAVTGAGTVRIAGGEVALDAAFGENVIFTSAGGELALARSQTYAGKISGFSTLGHTTLDLEDITFGSGTKATYSGASASGVLTVTDGAHTATITLVGDYTGAAFGVVSDGHGGVDVTAHLTPAPHAQPLAAAMAGFGASTGSSAEAGTSHPPPAPVLASPHV